MTNEKVLFCLNLKASIKEISRPRGDSEIQDAGIDSFKFIRMIIEGEHAKSRCISRTIIFLIYLLLLIPLSVSSLYFLKNFSNNYHIKSMHGVLGQE